MLKLQAKFSFIARILRLKFKRLTQNFAKKLSKLKFPFEKLCGVWLGKLSGEKANYKANS
jgi:hypothetical protein